MWNLKALFESIFQTDKLMELWENNCFNFEQFSYEMHNV